MNKDRSRSTQQASGIVRFWFDWAATDPSTAVIQTVAAACNREPMEMEAIYERVDPDALDAMFQRRRGAADSGDLAVSFSYERHEVTVTSDGEVIVKPQQQAAYLLALAFVDTAGGEGRIDEDLNVTHTGDDGVTRSIEAFVEEIEDDSKSVEEVFATLLVELPDACAIREIRPVRATPERD